MPAQCLKHADNLISTEDRNITHLDHDLQLACLDGQREARFRSDLKAQAYGLPDVGQSFILCLALAHASRDGGALRYPHPVFVPVQSYKELHSLPRLSDRP